jgi:sugar O-acyltransferase (sialic acid O-acetyltransferase NeuD family)
MAALVLVAASGLAREVIASIRDAGRDDVVGILDDDPALAGTSVAGVPVLGGADRAARCSEPLLLCAGQGRSRAALAARLGALGVGRERYATHVHPSAVVGDGSRLGSGTIVLAGSVLTCDVTVGSHVVLMPRVLLTHDDVVDDFATFAGGAALAGRVRVGTRAYLGTNSAVRQDLTVGADAVIGMGSVVLRDVPDGQTWAGNPATPLHRTEPVGILEGTAS